MFMENRPSGYFLTEAVWKIHEFFMVGMGNHVANLGGISYNSLDRHVICSYGRTSFDQFYKGQCPADAGRKGPRCWRPL